MTVKKIGHKNVYSCITYNYPHFRNPVPLCEHFEVKDSLIKAEGGKSHPK